MNNTYCVCTLLTYSVVGTNQMMLSQITFDSNSKGNDEESVLSTYAYKLYENTLSCS